MTLNLSAIKGGLNQDEDLISTLTQGMKSLVTFQN
jgi:hypothetical protein